MSKNENVSGISKCIDHILSFRLMTVLKMRIFRKQCKYHTVSAREIKITWLNYLSSCPEPDPPKKKCSLFLGILLVTEHARSLGNAAGYSYRKDLV